MRCGFWLPLLILCLPLQACETLGLSDPAPDPVLVDMGPICPLTAVLSDAVTVTKLRPGTAAATAAPNPANVAFSAEMSQAMLECNYNREQNSLTVDIEFAVKANRGPAASGPDPELDFFVAVIDSDNNVVAKSVYKSQPVMQGRTSNTYTQSVSNFPVPLEMDTRPYDFEILTGFQLTPDELTYNRIPRALPAQRAQAR